ncbi:MAG: YihY/virulence factor BrkB family protein [Acidimicrobiales bacterium]|nr:YihY/virulence factor BrkB family protein [Acidimicrobiales bacterium]
MGARAPTRLLSSARRVKRRADEHFLPLVAAGVAFYAFLALVPAVIVALAGYGLFADPDGIDEQLGDHAGAVPVEVRSLVEAQVRSIAAGGGGSRTVAVVVGTLLALWTASAGMNSLVRGVDIAHGRHPRRFVEQRGLSLALTLGAIVVVVLVALLVVVLPPALGTTEVGDVVRVVLDVSRWPLVFAMTTVALAVLYRVTGGGSGGLHLLPGPVVGAACWLVSSAGFSLYTANFSRYGRTYGSLAGVVVVLLWLWLGAGSVLVGAELDADRAKRAAGRD